MKCKHCNREIPDQSKVCPHCSAVIEREDRFKDIFGSNRKKKPEKRESSEKETSVPPEQEIQDTVKDSYIINESSDKISKDDSEKKDSSRENRLKEAFQFQVDDYNRKRQSDYIIGNFIGYAIIITIFSLTIGASGLNAIMDYVRGSEKKAQEFSLTSKDKKQALEKGSTTESPIQEEEDEHLAKEKEEKERKEKEEKERKEKEEEERKRKEEEEKKKEQEKNNVQLVIPDSNVRRISESELYSLSQYECRIARNEIYARHGRIFNDKSLLIYFRQFPWYQEKIPSDNFPESVLNSVEAHNRDTIVNYERKKGWR